MKLSPLGELCNRAESFVREVILFEMSREYGWIEKKALDMVPKTTEELLSLVLSEEALLDVEVFKYKGAITARECLERAVYLELEHAMHSELSRLHEAAYGI